MLEGRQFPICAVCGNEVHSLPPIPDENWYCREHRPAGCPGYPQHEHSICLLRARVDELERRLLDLEQLAAERTGSK